MASERPQSEVFRHLERIGASEMLRNGFASGPDIKPDDVIIALRTTPDGAGDAGFVKRLREVAAERMAREASQGGAGA